MDTCVCMGVVAVRLAYFSLWNTTVAHLNRWGVIYHLMCGAVHYQTAILHVLLIYSYSCLMLLGQDLQCCQNESLLSRNCSHSL